MLKLEDFDEKKRWVPFVNSVLKDHFIWGWCVHEEFFFRKSQAERYRDSNFQHIFEEDTEKMIPIKPALAPKNGMGSFCLILTEKELESLGPCPSIKSSPKKRLSLDPNLGDGSSRTVHDVPDKDLMQSILTWMEESSPGDEFTIRLVEMTDEEVENLPEV